MMTAMLAAENVFGADHDLWEVNVDREYHEEIRPTHGGRVADFIKLNSTQPRIPERLDLSGLRSRLKPEISVDD